MGTLTMCIVRQAAPSAGKRPEAPPDQSHRHNSKPRYLPARSTRYLHASARRRSSLLGSLRQAPLCLQRRDYNACGAHRGADDAESPQALTTSSHTAACKRCAQSNRGSKHSHTQPLGPICINCVARHPHNILMRRHACTRKPPSRYRPSPMSPNPVKLRCIASSVICFCPARAARSSCACCCV